MSKENVEYDSAGYPHKVAASSGMQERIKQLCTKLESGDPTWKCPHTPSCKQTLSAASVLTEEQPKVCGVCSKPADGHSHIFSAEECKTPHDVKVTYLPEASHPQDERDEYGEALRLLRKIAKDCEVFDGKCEWDHAGEFESIKKQIHVFLQAALASRIRK